ncbi:MAG: copper-binding protein, partial [Gammaproteobacteria bacterium]|nr:copper-binding protein [Gammaproteobacteria bacterium]
MTPDHDVTLDFHCHVPTHDEMGMHGRLVVGRGSRAAGHAHGVGAQPEHGSAAAPPAHRPGAPAQAQRHEGVGVVLSVDRRAGRVVLDHEAIEGFMAAMTMSYPV